MLFNWKTSQKKTVQRWVRKWGVPDLHRSIRVEYSRHMSKSLGRCYPARQLIRLNPVLAMDENKALLAETLCHELAHVAVFLQHGKGTRPHGPEWRALMELSGFTPRSVVPTHEVFALPRKRKRCKYRYLHRCIECHATFVAARTDSRWRCVSCYDAGREGLLVVSKKTRC